MADLRDLRDHLQSFLDGADAGPVATRELASAYAAMHPNVVEDATAALVEIGLMREIELVGRRRHKVEHGQGDLFQGFSRPTTIIVAVERDGRTRRLRKRFDDVTIGEVRAYLTHTRKERVSKVDTGVKAILERIRPHITGEDMTIAQAMAAADAADKLAAGREGSAITGGC